MKTKTPLPLRRIAAGLCGFIALALTTSSLSAQNTGPQQLVFTGLLGSTNTNPNAQFNAQFNAVQSDAAGNLYLLAAKGLHTSPENILFLDDRAENIPPALAVGMQVIQYTTHQAFEHEMHARGLDSLLQLEGHIDSQNGKL